MKRLFDLIVGMAMLVLTWPLMAVICLAIWLEDRHAPFFTQIRYGKDKDLFLLLKFRTMSVAKDGEDRPIGDHPALPVTKVGRILRMTFLDELPQLFNVLEGDMSLVGPRPMPLWVDLNGERVDVTRLPLFDGRSAVRPGMTGLTQMYYKGRSLTAKFRYDALYVRHASVWLDVCLLLVTAARCLRAISGLAMRARALIAVLLIVDAVGSMVVQFSDAFWPFQLGRLFRIGVGSALLLPLREDEKHG